MNSAYFTSRSKTRTRRLALCGLALASLCMGNGHAQDGGIEIFAGETIFAAGTRVSVTETWKRRHGLLQGSQSIADPLNQSSVEWRTVVGINHGFARHWSVSLLLPVVMRSLDTAAGKLSGEGLGDSSLLIKHNFHLKHWERSAWHSAFIAGIETPTGTDSERDGGALLSPSLQPSTGSWDPFVGVASTLDLDLWRFDFVALFKDNTEGGQDFSEGNQWTLSASAKYRFLHEPYPGQSASATLGFKWLDSQRSQVGGVEQFNSGRQEWLLKAGVGWHPRPDIDMSLSIDTPLHEHVGGQQLGLDSRVQLSFGWRF